MRKSIHLDNRFVDIFNARASLSSELKVRTIKLYAKSVYFVSIK